MRRSSRALARTQAKPRGGERPASSPTAGPRSHGSRAIGSNRRRSPHGDGTDRKIGHVVDEPQWATAGDGPDQVVPACRHFGTCGGCDLMHLDYAHQLRLKTSWLRTALRHIAGAEQAVSDFSADTLRRGCLHQRHKVHFVLRAEGRQPIQCGHYARDSRQFVPVDECPAHTELGNLVARTFARLAAEHGLAAEPAGPLRHIIVRVTGDGASAGVTVVVRRPEEALARVSRMLARELSAVRYFAVNLNTSDGPQIIGKRTQVLFHRQGVMEEIAGVRFLLSPGAFFQTNVSAAKELTATVLAVFEQYSRARVLDLYSGAGLFALPLAARGHKVVAVEGNPIAAADCVENARLNRIPHGQCRVVALTEQRALSLLDREGTAFDGVIVDPPRIGCPPGLLARILRRFTPETLVYVSCDPASLARDLRDVVGKLGTPYRVTSVKPIDMFPQTRHLECVCVLTRHTSEPTPYAS